MTLDDLVWGAVGFMYQFFDLWMIVTCAFLIAVVATNRRKR